jgi:acyl dehydratase
VRPAAAGVAEPGAAAAPRDNMTARLELDFARRPSTVAYMLRALRRMPGRSGDRGFPPLRARWSAQRIEAGPLQAFLGVTGLPAGGGVPLLYPHALGFPLQMVLLTHPAFPLPIWRVLQVRNHLLQHRPLAAGAVLDFETRVAGQRILAKGAEVDLHTTVRVGAALHWESLNTFYYRGRFGPAGEPSPLARAPDPGADVLTEWRMAAGAGWRLAGFTGDYNPIHWWGWYARRAGFQGAFHHPPLVLGQCLARLPAPEPGAPQRLDAWLKGPVYPQSDVRLHVSRAPEDIAFALVPVADGRPAILGRCRSGAASSPLLDERPAAQ